MGGIVISTSGHLLTLLMLGLLSLHGSAFGLRIETPLTLFSDRKRFRVMKEDLTSTRLASVQKYLRKLLKNGEIVISHFCVLI